MLPSFLSIGTVHRVGTGQGMVREIDILKIESQGKENKSKVGKTEIVKHGRFNTIKD